MENQTISLGFLPIARLEELEIIGRLVERSAAEITVPPNWNNSHTLGLIQSLQLYFKGSTVTAHHRADANKVFVYLRGDFEG